MINETGNTGEQVEAQVVAQAGTQSAGTTTPMAEATNVQAPTSFIESLPEDLRNEPSLQSYKDLGSMAKSLVSAQKELGSRIRIPGPDASAEAKAEFIKKLESVPGIVALPDKNNPESVNAFLNKLGRPESPDQYDIKVDQNLLNYVPGLKDKIPEFKVLAHQLGLNKEQAAALVNFETANTEKVIEKMLSDKSTTESLLREKWGSDFDNRFEAAKDIFGHYSSKYPEAVQSLINGVEGNNPVVLMMAAELGKVYKESGLISGTREVNYGLTPEEARSRISEVLNNPKHDYYSDNASKREAAIRQVEELYKSAYQDRLQNNS